MSFLVWPIFPLGARGRRIKYAPLSTLSSYQANNHPTRSCLLLSMLSILFLRQLGQLLTTFFCVDVFIMTTTGTTFWQLAVVFCARGVCLCAPLLYALHAKRAFRRSDFLYIDALLRGGDALALEVEILAARSGGAVYTNIAYAVERGEAQVVFVPYPLIFSVLVWTFAASCLPLSSWYLHH